MALQATAPRTTEQGGRAHGSSSCPHPSPRPYSPPAADERARTASFGNRPGYQPRDRDSARDGGAAPPVAMHPLPQQQQPRSGPRQWPQGQQPSPGKEVGRITRWDASRGYGFIRVFGRSNDVFVPGSKVLCDGPADERLVNWDVELRIVPDRWRPGKVLAQDVTGPNGRRVPLSGPVARVDRRPQSAEVAAALAAACACVGNQAQARSQAVLIQ